MKLGVYSVFDNKAKVFSQPFYAVNDSVAIRMFVSAVKDTSTALSKNPEDYSLYDVGQFDDALGFFLEDKERPEGPILLLHANNLEAI